MLLTDFNTLLAVIGSAMAAGFTALDGAVLIDEPRVTLFGMALGFVILEFFVSIINRFRGSPVDFTGTGAQPDEAALFKKRLEEVHGKRRRY